MGGERGTAGDRFKHLFKPLTFGRLTVKNRLECSPVDSALGSADGFVTGEMIEWTRARARGGAAIVTVGDTAIDYEYAKTHEFGLNLGDDRVIAGLSVLVENVHRYGAKLSMELNHGGRIVEPRFIGGKRPMAPSPLPASLIEAIPVREDGPPGQVPVEMTQADIDTVVARYADAVYRCLQAGMEMVMIHGGYRHLIGQFLSPFSNKRNDRYGGDLPSRARFALEVLDAVRNKVGDRMAIEYRMTLEEMIPGRMSGEETRLFEESLEFAKMIQDKVDLLHVSVGLIQPTYTVRGMNIHYAELFKKELKIPIATVGSITYEMAEDIISSGQADLVAMGRAHIADPDGVGKVRRGEPDQVRPCVRCDVCGDHVNSLKGIRCAVNPFAGRELAFLHPPAPARRKKVVVAGGGPGGMEAARTAAGRGHEVILFEKEARLGGALATASAPAFKEDMRRYLDWAVRTTMSAPGVTVRLNCEVTAAIIQAEKPDALVIAVGATPVVPDVAGVAQANVCRAGDVITGKAAAGHRAVVAGAGVTGCETALYLAGQGKKVTLVDVLPRVAMDATLGSGMALTALLDTSKVVIMTETRLDSITGTGVVTCGKDGRRQEIPCDTVVLALGVKPRAEVVRALGDLVPETYIVGDCAGHRGTLYQATTDGFFAGMEI